MKIYKMTPLTLLYEREIRVPTQKVINKTQSAQMTFLRNIRDC